MKRFWAISLLGCLCLAGFTGSASAEASKIATSLGDLRWGMSESEVITFVRRKIEEQYAPQIQKTHDTRKQTQLRDAMKSAQSKVQKSLVNFEGRSSRWDSSAIAGEFDYGNSESMVVYEDAGSQNYYFFVNGRLWKWYKALDTSAFGGGNFKKFTTSVEKKFGKGHAKTGEISPGQGKTQWVEYLDRNSRLRAADNTKRGVFALIFEEMATVRELASIRSPQPSRSSSYAQAEEQEDDSAGNAKANDNQIAKANTRKSIFADSQRTETDAEYKARRAQIAADEREKQQRMHQRKQEAKKGEQLKMDGIDDKDPLGGL